MWAKRSFQYQPLLCKITSSPIRSYISLPSLFSTNNNPSERKSQGIYFVEKTIVGFKRENLYDIVINVDEYKQFLPYCIESKILKSFMQVNSLTGEIEKGCMEALMKVGFSNPAAALLMSNASLQDSYISKIEYKQPEYILVKAETKGQNNIFDYLCSEWKFESLPQDPNCCIVHFTVDFRFSNTLYQYVAELFFKFLAKNMNEAFEKRCSEVYGKPKRKTEVLFRNEMKK